MDEKEEEVSKSTQGRELILDRKKIARMKERRACIILGKLFSRFSVRDSLHLTSYERAQFIEGNQIKFIKFQISM